MVGGIFASSFILLFQFVRADVTVSGCAKNLVSGSYPRLISFPQFGGLIPHKFTPEEECSALGLTFLERKWIYDGFQTGQPQTLNHRSADIALVSGESCFAMYWSVIQNTPLSSPICANDPGTSDLGRIRRRQPYVTYCTCRNNPCLDVIAHPNLPPGLDCYNRCQQIFVDGRCAFEVPSQLKQCIKQYLKPSCQFAGITISPGTPSDPRKTRHLDVTTNCATRYDGYEFVERDIRRVANDKPTPSEECLHLGMVPVATQAFRLSSFYNNSGTRDVVQAAVINGPLVLASINGCYSTTAHPSTGVKPINVPSRTSCNILPTDVLYLTYCACQHDSCADYQSTGVQENYQCFEWCHKTRGDSLFSLEESCYGKSKELFQKCVSEKDMSFNSWANSRVQEACLWKRLSVLPPVNPPRIPPFTSTEFPPTTAISSTKLVRTEKGKTRHKTLTNPTSIDTTAPPIPSRPPHVLPLPQDEDDGEDSGINDEIDPTLRVVAAAAGGGAVISLAAAGLFYGWQRVRVPARSNAPAEGSLEEFAPPPTQGQEQLSPHGREVMADVSFSR